MTTPPNDSRPAPEHASTFELDVHHAAGRPDSPLEAHVRACVACRAYLDELDAIGTEAPPPWAPKAAASVFPRRRWQKTRVPAFVAVAALAAGLVIYASRSRSLDDSGYVAAKGVPGIQILVKAVGDRPRVWDGRSTVKPGDALAIRVDCEGLRQVTVLGAPAQSPGATPATKLERLYSGACPSAPSVLPFTLVPDSEPGEERIAVVLSEDTLDDAALSVFTKPGAAHGSAAGANRGAAKVWTEWFTFPKEVRR